MTLCNINHFYRNKIFAENADCHNWNTAHNIIASKIINYDFQNQLYSAYIHLYDQFLNIIHHGSHDEANIWQNVLIDYMVRCVSSYLELIW